MLGFDRLGKGEIEKDKTGKEERREVGFGVARRKSARRGGCGSGFMSAEFDLVSIGALLQLWIFTIATFESVCCFTLCCLRQRLNLVLSSVSMRLRLKRTCSGVECFAPFHIKRFSFLFLFLRGGLT
nr:hypothetical protein CFP56_38094 [Quercus suber]